MWYVDNLYQLTTSFPSYMFLFASAFEEGRHGDVRQLSWSAS